MPPREQTCDDCALPAIDRDVELLVAGELWEYALAARTRQSLALEGLASTAYRQAFGTVTRPLPYAEVVSRMIEESASEVLVVVPAGVIAEPGFATALAESVRSDAPEQNGTPLTGDERPLLVGFRDPESGELSWRPIGPEVAQYVRQLEVEDDLDAPQPQRSYVRGRAHRRLSGSQLFQSLSNLPEARALEPEIRIVEPVELEQVASGWVYRCNNEPLDLNLSPARDCDTLVAVGAGIKPWHIANELRATLQRVMIVDAHRPQLGFAYRAALALKTAPNWRAFCDGSGFRSAEDQHLMQSHERLFKRIQRGLEDWHFDLTFIAADLLSQTLRLIDLLQQTGVRRPVIWYSNIFQPYLGHGLSEHHAGLEYSFVTLVRRVFPEAVLYSSGTEPVGDPRTSTVYPSLRFRLRRFIEQRLRLR